MQTGDNDSASASSSSSTSNSKKGSFDEALRPALLSAQVLGVLPLHASPLSRAIRTGVLLGAMLFVTAMAGATMIKEGVGLASSSAVVFYSVSSCALVLLSRLSGRWESVSEQWRLPCSRLSSLLGSTHCSELASQDVRRARKTTVILLLLSLTEYFLSSVNSVIPLLKCSSLGGIWSVYKSFIAAKFPMIVDLVPNSMWLSVVLLYINLVSTFMWNFVDILVVVVSGLLAKRFERFNQFLENVRGKECSALWWRGVREEYNGLAMLAKQMDHHFNLIVFLSFASNLYFICLQLLYNLMPKENWVSIVYFYCSSLWLLARASLVSMRAASVYEKSMGPVDILYSVPSKSFCTEVERLLIQTTTDTIALSGCRFFWVTRSVVLTLAGTVATYEIVLVQFNANQTNTTQNRTSECFM